jgi:hypothetical protein
VQAHAPQTSVAVFDDLLVIVGGGTVDFDLLRELYASGGHLVGADGGADQIVEAGLKPELIIGDFDSLMNPHSWLGKTRLMQISEQMTTDFEKSLYSTRAPVTVALGMTGRRFDHTLAALDAVTKYAQKRKIVLVDEEDVALALTASAGDILDFGGAEVSARCGEARAGCADRDLERGADRPLQDRAGGGRACAVPADPAAEVPGAADLETAVGKAVDFDQLWRNSATIAMPCPDL